MRKEEKASGSWTRQLLNDLPQKKVGLEIICSNNDDGKNGEEYPTERTSLGIRKISQDNRSNQFERVGMYDFRCNLLDVV